MKKIIAAAASAVLLLAGCSNSTAEEGTIEVTNSYVRATDEMSSMMGMLMTGAFMDITNNTGEDVTLIGGTTDAAEYIEIHEVVDGVMRQKEGGLVIAAGEMQTLKPGGNHVMLMGLPGDLVAGEEVTFILEFSNGDTVEVTAPVKVVNLDQEHYDNGESEDSSGM